MTWVLIFVYLGSIVAANLAVTVFGPWMLVLTGWVLIPFDLCVRDLLHERWKGNGGMLWTNLGLLIMAGGVLSILCNINAFPIALASCVAFASAAVVDSIVCHFLWKTGRLIRMNTSNLFSSCVDSVVFPFIAFGLFDLGLSLSQTVSKFSGGIVWTALFLVWLKERRKNDS